MMIIWDIARTGVVWGAICGLLYGAIVAIVAALAGGGTFFIGNINRWWGFWLVAPPAGLIVFALISGLGFFAGSVLSLQLPDTRPIDANTLNIIRNITGIVITVIASAIALIWLVWWKDASLWIRFLFVVLPVFGATSVVFYMVHRYLQRLSHL